MIFLGFLVLCAALIAVSGSVAFGLGWLLHWLVPAVGLGDALIFSAIICMSAAIIVFMVMKEVPKFQAEVEEDDDEESDAEFTEGFKTQIEEIMDRKIQELRKNKPWR
ncbi:MAG: hypothetical protein HY360_19515 [Verrucomicrobia bacterium]|nr:hypothetical protein [Verrucomicrobiota bacterium]